MLVLHDELHGVAAFAATETFEYAFCRRHAERGRLLVVKRADSPPIGTALFQRHVVGHHVHYLGGVHYAGYGRLVYHTAMAKMTPRN